MLDEGEPGPEDGVTVRVVVRGAAVVTLEYQSGTAEMEQFQNRCLFLVHSPGLSFIQQRRQDDSLVHLELGVEVETVTIPDGILQTIKGLASFGDLVDHFLIDFGATRDGAAQIGEADYGLKLGAVQVDLRCCLGRVGWRLAHDRRSLHVNDQAGGGEEVHVALRVPFCGCVDSAIVG
ncbi:hypothetical protein SprV_0502013600 [Sparganum proliferum]